MTDSVLRENWDNDTLATMVRLSAHLNTCWARDGLTAEEVCGLYVSPGQLMQITGRRRLDYARLTLDKLGLVAEITTSYFGDSTLVYWPKFAEFQGMDALESARERPPGALSATSTSTSTSRKNKRERARSKTRCPDLLPEEDWLAVQSWFGRRCPGLVRGLPHIWEEVRAWAEQNDHRRASWVGVLRTFCLRRIKDLENGQATHRSGSPRRQTALEAGEELLAEYEERERQRRENENLH